VLTLSRCPCGAQFCYICGLRWKTCECPQWEEPRLYARATQIAQRDADPRRRLFRPQRTIRAQPQIQAHFASSSTGVTTRATERSDSQDVDWEPDFSDHSEWEQDWTDAGENPTPAAMPSGASRSSDEEVAKPLEGVFPPTIGLGPTIHEHDTARSPALQSLVTHLRENHDCSHDRWRWLKGPHRCEQCHHRLPSYIFECKQCFCKLATDVAGTDCGETIECCQPSNKKLHTNFASSHFHVLLQFISISVESDHFQQLSCCIKLTITVLKSI
jgi:hypothetical protein